MPKPLVKTKTLKIAVDFLPGLNYLLMQIDPKGNIQLREERRHGWLPPIALARLHQLASEMSANEMRS